MLRRSPIFVALAPEQVSSGLQPDKHSLHKTLWETAENVTFFSGKVRRRVPPVTVLNLGADPVRGLSQQQATDGVRWLWSTSGGKVTRWYGPPAETVIAAAAWQEDATFTLQPTFFDFTHYGNWTIINSGLGKAKLFKPPAAPVDFGDAPSNVLRFMKKLNFIMAIGYGDRGTRVGWSDGDNIEVWTPTASNLAGGLSVDDFDTRIRAAATLGQSISVYSEDQMGLVNYIGTPFYFGQRTMLDGIGAVGKCAVATDGKNNVGVGRGGIWWTDSNSYRYIDEGYLHDYLQDEVNWEQAAKVQAVRNDYTGCYEFFFPMRDSLEVNEGWCFDPRTGGWTPLTGLSMKDERKLFQKPVIGTNAGLVQFDASDETQLAPLKLETKPLLLQVQGPDGFADVHTSSKVDEVELLVKAAVGIEFRVKSSQQAHQDFEVGPWTPVEPNAKTYQLGALPDGVYWKLEFRSVLNAWDFDFQGFLLFGAIEGSKRTFS